MLPRIPLPRADRLTRERNERRRSAGPNGDRCLICEAPLAGKVVGLNYHNASDTVADPDEMLPDGGLHWVGATCARKVPAAYRIPWVEKTAVA